MRRVLLSLSVIVLIVACGGQALDAGSTQRKKAADDAGAVPEAATGGRPGSGGSAAGNAGNGGSSPEGGAGSPLGSGGNVAGNAGDGGSGGAGGSFGSGGSAGSIEPPRPALCGGIQCPNGQACCLVDGRCFDPSKSDQCRAEAPLPEPRPEKLCVSHADCGTLEFCMAADPNACFGNGHCQPRNAGDQCFSLSPTNGCRVCACDGNDYPNMQSARLAGARVASPHGGSCGDAITIGGGTSGSGPEKPPFNVIACATDSNCPAGNRCCSRFSICYDAALPVLCSKAPAGTRIPCVDDTQCIPEFEFCRADGCDGPGGCAAISTGDCGVILDPVCGCNGVTYTSPDCAHAKGMRIRAKGACP